jgi:hypothetical protein
MPGDRPGFEPFNGYVSATVIADAIDAIINVFQGSMDLFDKHTFPVADTKRIAAFSI